MRYEVRINFGVSRLSAFPERDGTENEESRQGQGKTDPHPSLWDPRS
jgi:hypothetical protein